MKTKVWIGVLVLTLAVCLGLSLWLLLPGQDAAMIKIWSQGELLHTLPLDRDTVLEVVSQRGNNVITVKNGKAAVTEADCPDGYCMARGYCSSGAQIVCLPNRLVIEFVGEQAVDGVAG